MKIGIPKETQAEEKRVAATPDTVKKLVEAGFTVAIEQGAGEGSHIPDQAFIDAGAEMAANAEATLGDADIVFKVRRPQTGDDGGPNELGMIKQGATLVAMLAPYAAKESIPDYAAAGIDAFALELMPRISRAQSMDVLSSQSNLAGYHAVVECASYFTRAFPMMMTAAGTVAPAKVMVFGGGVAGLQAIATAKRMGAVVSATDVRPAVKEQVESLGGKFVMVDSEETEQAETEGGYAKEMSDEYKRKQAELIAETMAKQDIAITTALIPGRPAPMLISEEVVKSMAPGSVIYDLAAETGGNCELTEPGRIVVKHDVTIIGHLNSASRLAGDASALYAKNLLNFVSPHFAEDGGTLTFDWDDETVSGTALTRGGKVVHPLFS